MMARGGTSTRSKSFVLSNVGHTIAWPTLDCSTTTNNNSACSLSVQSIIPSMQSPPILSIHTATAYTCMPLHVQLSSYSLPTYLPSAFAAVKSLARSENAVISTTSLQGRLTFLSNLQDLLTVSIHHQQTSS